MVVVVKKLSRLFLTIFVRQAKFDNFQHIQILLYVSFHTKGRCI